MYYNGGVILAIFAGATAGYFVSAVSHVDKLDAGGRRIRGKSDRLHRAERYSGRIRSPWRSWRVLCLRSLATIVPYRSPSFSTF